MPDNILSLKNHFCTPLKVWVLVPYLQTNDENLDYYYDFSQSIAEYNNTFSELGINWKWQPVTMDNYVAVINNIVSEKEAEICFPIILNICDGDETNKTPGISVIKLLEEKQLIYTGSDDFFYDITTSKIPMKIAFGEAGIPTPGWTAITKQDEDISGIFDRLGRPVILKPSVSGGSMGVGTKNVVYNELELTALIKEMFNGYRGWNLVTDGLIAESFINGPEYTSLIVGNYREPDKALIYEPVERTFHPSLPDDEKFLSFDRLWEIYEEEEAMPNQDNFYEYSTVNPNFVEEIKKISWDAFASVKGMGYARVDIRADKLTGKMYVLEVNAQCGISDDEDYTSIGAILKVSGKTFTSLVKEIIQNAINRNKHLLPELKNQLS